MRCPYCTGEDTIVKDSRPVEDNTVIRRRRECLTCGGRFTSYERIQLRELSVIKRDGRRIPFNREKLMNSALVALRKRMIDVEHIEKMVSGIVRQLENIGKNEVYSKDIGNLMMNGLRLIDEVAYVRYASVYKDFHEVDDFKEFIGSIDEDDLAEKTKTKQDRFFKKQNANDNKIRKAQENLKLEENFKLEIE